MTKPIVLVHGAWHGAWCFQKLSELLRNKGVDTTSVNLPLLGPEGDIETARQVINEKPGAVVLGHSYGGLVITHASLRADVSHLVYLSALMPDVDEDINEAVATAPATALETAMVFEADGSVSINPDLAVDAFYDDCDRNEAADAVARLRPQVLEPFPILSDEPSWKEISSTYVVCKDDKALHPELQSTFARRAENVFELPGAHSPFLSRPGEVAEILLNLV
ncbi:MAG: alpha/beta hydrolase [bacterium]|jgi:pimeloyl-ACP methyl ester carboxylesterase|nr:alpha/beta hydrolase [Gammaproteobacteria bacterium]